ncbi:BTB/POZ domain-containing protein At2g46260-like [Henckelia pumila]|uniref:BTB/POZ domain-containing protein At2g46260-like n=1 Tax=Henckelia pumila TaxID=405737 RepID=UPI003C6E86CB
MDSDLNPSPTREADLDFGFTFNNSNFSDRILRIEIVDIVERDTGEFFFDNHQRYCVRDEAANGDDSDLSDDCPKVLRVEMLHISSPILAARSPFFYKLFSNGMLESAQRHATLRILASEEAAFMELLNFMYSNTLTVTTAPAILNVLMAADKFEVISCMRHCSRLLRNLPMTREFAFVCLESLDLPSSVVVADVVQPLADAAKQFLVSLYGNISLYPNELMHFPLAGIEAILSSDDLKVDSEDEVYDFVIKWTRTHYQSQEDRRRIIRRHLGRYIRFPYITGTKLRNVFCPDIDPEFTGEALYDALFFKIGAPLPQRARAIEREYKHPPVKAIEFDVPHRRCMVYLDLTREECSRLHPSGVIHSQAFHLEGQEFTLAACRISEPDTTVHSSFGIFLRMHGKRNSK